VHGNTAEPDQDVVVYTRRIDEHTARKSPVLTSGPDRSYSWSFRIARMTHFWAHAGGLNSPVHTTALVQASCTVSGPAFTKLPFGLVSDPDPDQMFAAFTANRAGTWAGYAADGTGDFAVLRWSAGAGVRVVDRFSYRTFANRSVNPVGVTPGGRIVAAVQDPASSPGTMLGLYWDQGVRRHLRMKPTWTAAWPVHVLDSGAVVGVARQTGGDYAVAIWPNVEAAPNQLASIGSGYPGVMADDAGDIVWMRDSGRKSDVVRLRNGEIRALAVPGLQSASFIPTAGGRYAVYGWGLGVVRWDFSDPPASGPITGAFRTGSDGGNAKATTAGRHGDFVVGDSGPRHLLTPTGAWVTVPPEADHVEDIGESIAADGTVAFTSSADGLPHFLRCS
jgi:hypothetical protein